MTAVQASPARSPAMNEPCLDPRAARLVARRWASHGLTYLALRPGNHVLMSDDGQACLGYTKAAGLAVALGPPAGLPGAWEGLLQRFQEEAHRMKLRPALCGIPEGAARLARGLGFRTASIGDEAIVDPDRMDLRGKRWRETRAALNRAALRGLTFQWAAPEDRGLGLGRELGEVSQAWLAGKRMPELRFALGSLASVTEEEVRLGVARSPSGAALGFITWVPVPAKGGWMLELLRRRPEAMAGLSDYLVASSLLSFRSEGLRYASLSGTPLAGDGVTARSLVAALLSPARAVYDCRGLRHFKAKFNPRWQQLYVAYEGPLGLPRALLGIARACAPETGLAALARLPLAAAWSTFGR